MVKALDCEFSLFKTFVPHTAFHVGYFAFAVQKATNGNVTAELSARVAAKFVWIPSSLPAAPGTQSSLHLSVCTALSIGLYFKNTGLKGTGETKQQQLWECVFEVSQNVDNTEEIASTVHANSD